MTTGTEAEHLADPRQALRALLEVPGVIGAGRWRVGADPAFHLTRYDLEVGDLAGPVGWWISNFSEINMMITQAQTIDYDNESGTRSFHPPRSLLLRGGKFSLLTHANRVYAILENELRPDVWSITRQLEGIAA